MRGGIGYQVTEVFNKSEIFRPGTSKHAAKQAARTNGAKTWHQIGEELYIYSYNTAKTYKDVWHRLADYCKAEMGLRDIEMLSGDHIMEYLLSRLEDEIAWSSFETETAALQKLEKALNIYSDKFSRGNRYNFQNEIDEAREEAREELPRRKLSRAYADPEAIIAHLSKPQHKVVARIQLEGDARISEASHIKAGQLMGLARDSVTGHIKGVIALKNTKGGKPRNIMISRETYSLLEELVGQAGKLFHVAQYSYMRAVKIACAKAGQAYNGPHGFRWCYAQRRVAESQAHGYTYEQALLLVGRELGHERADITQHYAS
jgi:integrase